MAPKKRDVTLKQVADEVGMKVDQVRDILREAAAVSKATGDRVFSAARKLGYDLRKLKIGKRMQTRKETLEEVLGRISGHAAWTRPAIRVRSRPRPLLRLQGVRRCMSHAQRLGRQRSVA